MIPADERLEQMASNRVPDDQPMRRDPEREPVHDNIDRPRWCPAGLTRSQKRRVQRLRQTEALEEVRKEASRKGVRSEFWCVNPKADFVQQSGSSAAPINMIFMLPSEFMAPDDDEKQDLEEAMAQLNSEPIPATFEKAEDEKRKHLKALFLKGFVDGKPVTKLLVDGGGAVNIMPYTMLRKLGKSSEDLRKLVLERIYR